MLCAGGTFRSPVWCLVLPAGGSAAELPNVPEASHRHPQARHTHPYTLPLWPLALVRQLGPSLRLHFWLLVSVCLDALCQLWQVWSSSQDHQHCGLPGLSYGPVCPSHVDFLRCSTDWLPCMSVFQLYSLHWRLLRKHGSQLEEDLHLQSSVVIIWWVVFFLFFLCVCVFFVFVFNLSSFFFLFFY